MSYKVNMLYDGFALLPLFTLSLLLCIQRKDLFARVLFLDIDIRQVFFFLSWYNSVTDCQGWECRPSLHWELLPYFSKDIATQHGWYFKTRQPKWPVFHLLKNKNKKKIQWWKGMLHLLMNESLLIHLTFLLHTTTAIFIWVWMSGKYIKRLVRIKLTGLWL